MSNLVIKGDYRELVADPSIKVAYTKSLLLGLKGDDLLYNLADKINNTYKGLLTVSKTESFLDEQAGLGITKIKDNINTIEIPDIPLFKWRYLFDYSALSPEYRTYKSGRAYRVDHQLTTVKLPKSCDNISLSFDWLRKINRLFVYNTTNIDKNRNISTGELKMVIVHNDNYSKPQIIRM